MKDNKRLEMLNKNAKVKVKYEADEDEDDEKFDEKLNKKGKRFPQRSKSDDKSKKLREA